MTTALSEGMAVNFAMVPIEPAGPLMTALREGRIQRGDIALVWALLSHVDWRSGRTWATTTELAATLGSEPEVVEQALARLQREALVARGADVRQPIRKFWCVNPFAIGSTGGKHRRERQYQQFLRALG